MKDNTMEQMQENAITMMEDYFSQDEIDFACDCILKAGGNIPLTIQALSVDAALPPELVAAIVM